MEQRQHAMRLAFELLLSPRCWAPLVVGAGAFVAYLSARDDDPGLTTEFALVPTCFLDGLAIGKPVLAGGVGAVLTVAPAAREPMPGKSRLDCRRHVQSMEG